jgi:hypothetical protein
VSRGQKKFENPWSNVTGFAVGMFTHVCGGALFGEADCFRRLCRQIDRDTGPFLSDSILMFLATSFCIVLCKDNSLIGLYPLNFVYLATCIDILMCPQALGVCLLTRQALTFWHRNLAFKF